MLPRSEIQFLLHDVTHTGGLSALGVYILLYPFANVCPEVGFQQLDLFLQGFQKNLRCDTGVRVFVFDMMEQFV